METIVKSKAELAMERCQLEYKLRVQRQRKNFLKLTREIDNLLQTNSECKVYFLRSNNDDNVCEISINDKPSLEVNQYLETYNLTGILSTDFLRVALEHNIDSIHEILYVLQITSEYEENIGKDISGAIIYIWSWEKYIGYCRNFHGFRIGERGETESNLSDNSERTFHHSESIILTNDELVCMSKDEIIDYIENELCNDSYKWNYFKNGLNRDKIEEFIENNF